MSAPTVTPQPTVVPVEDGKYFVVIDPRGHQVVTYLRDGQPWAPSSVDDLGQLMIAMVSEIEELRDEVVHLEGASVYRGAGERTC